MIKVQWMSLHGNIFYVVTNIDLKCFLMWICINIFRPKFFEYNKEVTYSLGEVFLNWC